MNTRDYKQFSSGLSYHVFNRGNNKEEIFKDNQDFLMLLIRLKILLGQIKDPKLRLNPFPENSFTVLSYCLMSNHYHFFIRQEDEFPVSELIRRLFTSYVKYFNLKYNRVGNLFQDTFKAKVVQDKNYYVNLSAYIHNNPPNPENYPYSSFPEFIGTRQGTICNPEPILSFFNNDKSKYLNYFQNYLYKEYEKIKHLTFENE